MKAKTNISKKIISGIMIIFMVFGNVFFVSCSSSVETAAEPQAQEQMQTAQKQNVILLISDGLSPSNIDFVRSYKQKSLYYEKYYTGQVVTNSLSSGATDSAASATTYSTGKKTHNGYLSMNKKGEKYETLAEYANSEGLKTGLVTTCEITNATPAAFYSHVESRKSTEKISRQLVKSDINVILSAGSYYLKKENRKDKRDIISEMKKEGYTYITKKEQIGKSKGDKVLGLFGSKYIKNEKDNKDGKYPTLDLMTKNAIRLLSENNDKGFFLMVEGSKIDWAAHNKDSIGVLSETLSFEKACKTAIDFAKKDKNTTVIIVSDHRNGEVSRKKNKKSKVNLTKADRKTIKGFKYTPEEMAKKVKGKSIKNIKKIIKNNTPIKKVSDKDAKKIKKAKNKEKALAKLYNKYIKLKWSSSGHNRGKVKLYIYPAENTSVIKGNSIDNTKVNKYIKDILKSKETAVAK